VFTEEKLNEMGVRSKHSFKISPICHADEVFKVLGFKISLFQKREATCGGEHFAEMQGRYA
jgi:hypothetical protein